MTSPLRFYVIQKSGIPFKDSYKKALQRKSELEDMGYRKVIIKHCSDSLEIWAMSPRENFIWDSRYLQRKIERSKPTEEELKVIENAV